MSLTVKNESHCKKNRSRLEKKVTFEKNVSFKKRITLQKIGRTVKNGSHAVKMGHTVRNGLHCEERAAL